MTYFLKEGQSFHSLTKDSPQELGEAIYRLDNLLILDKKRCLFSLLLDHGEKKQPLFLECNPRWAICLFQQIQKDLDSEFQCQILETLERIEALLQNQKE